MYLYSNIVGTFVLNQNFQIREKILFSDNESYTNYLKLAEGETLDSEKKFLTKFKNIRDLRKEPSEAFFEKQEEIFKGFREEMRKKNTYITRKQVKESVSTDLLIVQASHSVDELKRTINILLKRLREWYGYILPELDDILQDHEMFLDYLLKKSKPELMKHFKIKDSMGADIPKKDYDEMLDFARSIKQLYDEKAAKEKYLENIMKKNCPNLTAVAGYLIGAKLISIAGSLKNMVLMPASTIQLLGAEKALFRHLVNRKIRPPKHGVIHEHPILQKAKKEDKGKVARMLGDKILLAVKVDYFKGKFIGDKLKKDIEDRFR